jgi:hypothetical protein
VSPGIILETEYHDALTALLQQQGLPSEFRYAQAFILFCGYRFGLRGNEALGLRRDDWQEKLHPWEILVRPNDFRSLKTRASRRHVPLLFELTSREQDILRHVLKDPQLRYDWQSSPYLFSEAIRGSEWRLKGGINEVLKQVTGNPKTVLHHARHTVANQVATALYRPRLPNNWKSLSQSIERDTIYNALLRTPSITRRASWATAIFLGHGGPKTTFLNYVHFIGDWANQRIGLKSADTEALRSTMTQVIPLEGFSEKAPVDLGLLSTLTPPLDEISPGKILQVLRFLALGQSCRQSAELLCIDPAFCEKFEQIIDSLRLKVQIKTTVKEAGLVAPADFLTRVTIDGWKRLMAICEKTEKDKALPMGSMTPGDLRKSIGATRQILLWKKRHFAAFRGFLDYYAFEKLSYVLVRTEETDEQLLAWLNENHLKAKSCHDLTFKTDREKPHSKTKENISTLQGKKAANKKTEPRGFEIDRICRGDRWGYEVRVRCAAVLTRNQNSELHGSYEWVTLFIAWVIATHIRGQMETSSPQ